MERVHCCNLNTWTCKTNQEKCILRSSFLFDKLKTKNKNCIVIKCPKFGKIKSHFFPSFYPFPSPVHWNWGLGRGGGYPFVPMLSKGWVDFQWSHESINKRNLLYRRRLILMLLTFHCQVAWFGPFQDWTGILEVWHTFMANVPTMWLNRFYCSGLSTWSVEDVHVDIEGELSVITDCSPPGEEARGGKSGAREG